MAEKIVAAFARVLRVIRILKLIWLIYFWLFVDVFPDLLLYIVDPE